MSCPTPLSASRWARARWFVLAPHPDDETLGAGALIAETARRGRLAGVAFLTDGEGSHPGGGRALAAARRAEAVEALRRLTGAVPPLLWIGWPDAHPPRSGDPRRRWSVRVLAAELRRQRVRALAVTAGCEPHCDHAAAHAVALEAARLSQRRIAVFEYLVWAPAPPPGAQAYRTQDLKRSARRAALQAHRSQLTPRFGPGFRLPPHRQRAPAFDTLYLRRTPG